MQRWSTDTWASQLKVNLLLPMSLKRPVTCISQISPVLNIYWPAATEGHP